MIEQIIKQYNEGLINCDEFALLMMLERANEYCEVLEYYEMTPYIIEIEPDEYFNSNEQFANNLNIIICAVSNVYFIFRTNKYVDRAIANINCILNRYR